MKFNINFMGNSKKYFILSAALIAIIVASLLVFGVQLDIQFRGGAMITYAYSGTVDASAFEQTADSLLAAPVSVRESSDIATGMQALVVTLPGSQNMTAEEILEFTTGLQAAYPQNGLRAEEVSSVNPVIGADFLRKSLWAVAFASILMVIFVAFRFRKIGGMSAGVMGLVALIHDVIIVFGVFVLFRIPVDDNFIAVVLTILGYSLNDTIVIYDRIRENRRLMGSKAGYAELVNLSINQSLVRSINTTVTTILSMIVVAVVAYIYGVTSIQSFALPMIAGLVSGTYSSVCIAGPLWVRWQERKLAKAGA
jgi:preprotein translocase SecF subunit